MKHTKNMLLILLVVAMSSCVTTQAVYNPGLNSYTSEPVRSKLDIRQVMLGFTIIYAVKFDWKKEPKPKKK